MVFNADIGTSIEGRYIGVGRDQSAPTDDRFIVLKLIIGTYKKFRGSVMCPVSAVAATVAGLPR